MRYMPLGLLALALLANSASAKIITSTVSYKVGQTAFQGYLAYDDTIQEKRPGVLVFPEWWGLVAFAKQKAEQLARLGYVAFAADMYGDGQTTDDPQQAGKMAGQLQPPQLRERAQAALETLRKQETVDGSKVAAIGFCFGGKVALQLAYSGASVQAVVTFHGDLTPPSAAEAKGVKAQILVCTGADDPMAPPEKVDTFWQALRDTGVVWQLNVYSNAKHSFTNPAADKHNMPGVGYNAIAAERSWNAMQQFFREAFERKTPLQTQPVAR